MLVVGAEGQSNFWARRHVQPYERIHGGRRRTGYRTVRQWPSHRCQRDDSEGVVWAMA